jgi:hypothetical protein
MEQICIETLPYTISMVGMWIGGLMIGLGLGSRFNKKKNL